MSKPQSPDEIHTIAFRFGVRPDIETAFRKALQVHINKEISKVLSRVEAAGPKDHGTVGLMLVIQRVVLLAKNEANNGWRQALQTIKAEYGGDHGREL